MVFPLISRAIHNRHPADSYLADVGGERGAGADCAEEGVPAICDFWAVKECKIERLEWTWCAASGDAVVDCLVLGGEVGWVWVDVWDSHFGG